MKNFNIILKLLQTVFLPVQKKNNKASRYNIVAQEFEENSSETLFKIIQYGSDKYIKLTAKQFALNKELLYQLSQEDAYLIGFTVASELAAREKCAMLNLKLESGGQILV